MRGTISLAEFIPNDLIDPSQWPGSDIGHAEANATGIIVTDVIRPTTVSLGGVETFGKQLAEAYPHSYLGHFAADIRASSTGTGGIDSGDYECAGF